MTNYWIPADEPAPLDGPGFGIEKCGTQWRLTYQPHMWTTPLATGGRFAPWYDSAEEAQAAADRANDAKKATK